MKINKKFHSIDINYKKKLKKKFNEFTTIDLNQRFLKTSVILLLF